ncbi:MAG TPA: hypothetical protein DCF78_17650, partial [Dehalococcoidia bacterium]|nr:hypothetical protein [Dehalococcoidia bacterium]
TPTASQRFPYAWVGIETLSSEYDIENSGGHTMFKVYKWTFLGSMVGSYILANLAFAVLGI